jgi:hypothetical protein
VQLLTRRELAGILGDDLDAVRHCNQLPGRPGQRLAGDHADHGARH